MAQKYKGTKKSGSGKAIPQKENFRKKGYRAKCTDDTQKIESSGDNAATWYNKVFGAYSPLENTNQITVQNAELLHNTLDLNQPDVMTFRWIPSFGVGKSNNDALNILAQQNYSWVRHWNSGSRNYEATDLMQVILALANAYIYVLYLTKVYGSLNLFSHVNYGFPRSLANSLNINWEDIVKHQSELHSYINTLIYRLNSYCIPSDFDFVKRWFFMTEPLFVDDYYDSFKNQFINFVPRGLYLYDWQHAQSILVNVLNPLENSESESVAEHGGFTYDGLVTVGNDLMAIISQYEDIGIICGDILKAFGEQSIYRLKPIDYSYQVPVLRVENEFANELRNMHITNLQSMVLKEDVESGPDQLDPENWINKEDVENWVFPNTTIYADGTTLNVPTMSTQFSYPVVGQCTITQDGMNLVYNPTVVLGVTTSLNMGNTYGSVATNPYIGDLVSGAYSTIDVLKTVISKGRIINLINKDHSADDVLVATRFCPTYDLDSIDLLNFTTSFINPATGSNNKYITAKLQSCDTMLITSVSMYGGSEEEYLQDYDPSVTTITVHNPMGPSGYGARVGSNYFARDPIGCFDDTPAVLAPYQIQPNSVTAVNYAADVNGHNLSVYGIWTTRNNFYAFVSGFRLCPTATLISYRYGTTGPGYNNIDGTFTNINTPSGFNTNDIGPKWVRVPMSWNVLEISNRNSVYSQLFVAKFGSIK